MQNKLKYLIAIILSVITYAVGQNTPNKYYDVGVDDDSVVINYYHKFQQAVKNDDSVYLSKIVVKYPMKINLSNSKTLTIKNEKDFRQNYRIIFDSKLKSFIQSQSADNLSAMTNGIMLGRGQVWFSYIESEEKLYLWTISNSEYLYK